MSAYTELLDATISHLEGLKRDGKRYVQVSRKTLDGLARIAQSTAPGTDPLKLMNSAFEPARTPFDW